MCSTGKSSQSPEMSGYSFIIISFIINDTHNLRKVLCIMNGYLGSVLHSPYHRAPFMSFCRRTTEIIIIVISGRRKG